MQPKVSVIVPVYNVMPYLNKCLKSLVKQTLKDIEILVINDGSPDDSQKIIDLYQQQFPHLIKSYIKENGGLSDARNYGIERANGEYIAFVDSDDFVRTDMLEKLYNTAIEEDAEIVICDFTQFKKNSKKTHKKTKKKYSRKYRSITSHIEKTDSVIDNPEILRRASSYAWNKLYKKELFEKYDIKFPIQWFEDSAVIYNLVAVANKVAVVHESLYRYRVERKGAITNTFDRRIFDIFKSCQSIIEFFNKHDLMTTLHNEVEYLCIMHLHARLIALRKTIDIKIQWRFAEECFEFLDTNFPYWRDNVYYVETKNSKILRNQLLGFEGVRDDLFGLKSYYLKRYFFILIYKRLYKANLKKIKKSFKKLRKKFKKKEPTNQPPKQPKEKRDILDKVRDTISNIVIDTQLTEAHLTDEAVLSVTYDNLTEEERAQLELHEQLRQEAAAKREKEVHDLQNYSLQIMKVIHDFCEENGIKYFMAEGSLLGAVRHQGVIPWDDDIDIGMLREDYIKFIKLWNKKEIKNCKLLHNTTYKKYYLPFAKIVLCKETGFYNNQRYFPEEYQGPFVDIFPFDESIPPENKDLIAHFGRIRRLRDFLLIKIKYISKPGKRRLLWLPAHLYSYNRLHKTLDYMFRAFEGNNYGFVGNFCSSYPITRETFNKNWFNEVKLTKFNDYEFYIPQNADEILTTIYGDYMTPPPENKRVCKHSFTVNDEIREKIEQK